MILAPRRHLVMLAFLVGVGGSWHLGGQSRDALKHSTLHRTAPPLRIIRPLMSTVPRWRKLGLGCV